MPSLTFGIRYRKNDGVLLSSSEVREQFMFGIPFIDDDGQRYSGESIRRKVKSATVWLENYLGLSFIKRKITDEKQDYIREEFAAFGYVKTDYPLNEVLDLRGFISDVQQIQYPPEWISFKKSTKNLNVVPAGQSAPFTSAVIFSGITPHLGWFGLRRIPNYWHVTYCTGFDVIPFDIIEVIGKIATLSILGVISESALRPGVSSLSLSIDGLSQSVSSSRSAGTQLFAGRIKQIAEELVRRPDGDLETLKQFYKGITFNVV